MTRNLFIVSILAIVFISCEKKEITTSVSTTTTSETLAKFTVMASDGVVKANYTVLMFATKATQGSPLPSILAQAVSDSQGVATLYLENVVTSSSPKTYYFIAVQQQGSNYVWKTPYMQAEVSLKKGTTYVSSIFVQ